jgi:hypothetical protein
MTQRSSIISRARLIKSALATSFLAGCGGGTAPAPVSQPTAASAACVAFSTSSADRFGLKKLFANSVFKNLDRQKLLDAFDPSPHLDALQAGYFKRSGARVQQGRTIRQIPTAGIVITSPGTYTLSGDTTWTPSGTTTSAITIQSSNVTLDLGGYTLTASISDNSIQTTGILVGAGPLENITIKNGTVASFTEYGIQARQVCGLNISGITVTGLSMNNLGIRLATPTGIFVGLSLNVGISNCNVTQTNITTDSGAGIQLISTNLATVTNCAASSLVNNDGSMQGFSYVGCGYVTTTDCTATSFQTHFGSNIATPGHTCIGFIPTFCQNLSFVNCAATGMTGCCDDCHGMSVFLSAAVTVSGFQASQIVDGVNVTTHSQSGAKATGLEVYSLGGTGVSVSDCVVSNVKAINPEDLQAAGYSAWGSTIEFQRCSAANVTVQNDNNVADMRGIGFGWAPDPRTEFSGTGALFVTYTDCTASSCDVAFDTWDHVLSTWTNPTYTNCTTGFLVEPGAQRVLSCDGCSECPGPPYGPNPATVTLTNFASSNTYPS